MIQENYESLCAIPSDINENLPVLKKYAQMSNTVVELGVRSIVSTWALLAGKPKLLISVDIEHPSVYGGNIWEVMDAADAVGIEFSFVQRNSLEISLPEHDFLFIDTVHTKQHLSRELKKHAHLVKKYIAFHDTHIPDIPEMMECIQEFVTQNPEWKIIEDHKNNNGLTVCARVK